MSVYLEKGSWGVRQVIPAQEGLRLFYLDKLKDKRVRADRVVCLALCESQDLTQSVVLPVIIDKGVFAIVVEGGYLGFVEDEARISSEFGIKPKVLEKELEE